MKKVLSLLIVLTLVYSQTNPALGNSSQSSEANQQEIAQSEDGVTSLNASEALEESSDHYVIEAGDLLEINILGEEELSRTLMVMYNGTISFPLIGEIKVAGHSTKEAAVLLAEKLKEYYAHPVVSIILKSPTLPYVSVFGEVFRQGSVEYQRGLKITDYIALAGGPTGNANLKSVRVVRFQDGEPIAKVVNVQSILDGRNADENVALKAGDWIHVSRKFTINWGVVLQLTTLALTAFNVYLTLQNSQ